MNNKSTVMYAIIITILACVSISMFMCICNQYINNKPRHEHFRAGISRDLILNLSTNREVWIFIDKNSTKNYTKFRYVTRIGSNYNNGKDIKINNISDKDRIVIIFKNSIANGYFGGHIKYNDIVYPTSSDGRFKCTGYRPYTNYSKLITGGKRIGCYRDNGRRMLPNLNRNKGRGYFVSNEECREWAHDNNYKYYGLQYGGECWGGNSLERATSLGKLSDRRCMNRNKSGKYINFLSQFQGGGWANDIYQTDLPPRIREMSGAKPNTPIWANGISAKYINAEDGPHELHGSIYTYVEFEWSPPEEPEPMQPPKIPPFCADIRYRQFNGASCKDNSSTEKCMNTPLVGYTPTKSKEYCINLFKPYTRSDAQMILQKALHNIDYKDYSDKAMVDKAFKQKLLELLEKNCILENSLNDEDKDKCITNISKMIKNKNNKLVDLEGELIKVLQNIFDTAETKKISKSDVSVLKELLDDILDGARRINGSASRAQNNNYEGRYIYPKHVCCNMGPPGTCVSGCNNKSKGKCNNQSNIPYHVHEKNNCTIVSNISEGN